MTFIDELARLLDRAERASGACSLARIGGATHLILFLRDPEVHKFLPAPGFPQRLAGGMEWSRFLLTIAQTGREEAQMLSPYSGSRVRVSGFLLEENAVVVLFGDAVHPDAHESLAPSLRILSAMLIQEVRANMAEMQASLAQQSVVESKQLANALSNAHDMLAQALHTREALLTEMRTKDERLQLVRQISGIGTWEFSGSTSQVQFSPETAAIYGMPLEPFSGDRSEVLSRIHPEDRARFSQQMDASMSRAGDFNVQFRVVWPNGVVRWVEDRGSVLRDRDGNNPVMIGFSLDITQRIMTEETLVRSEKLAAAGRLAASIAHEINNPLEALVNIIYLAKDNTDLHRIHELLTIADDELVRISTVARQALGFYRDVNTSISFDVVTTVKQVIELFKKQISDTGVLLKPELMEEPVQVLGWPGEIKQAISNLLINAVHASSQGTSIRIRIKRAGSSVHLAIADTGHGISREHRLHIFEPFFSTKKSFGTGLGLWVTKQIIEKHGGTIAVRSSNSGQRQGTVFLLTLPLASAGKRFEAPEQHLRYRSL